MSRSTIPNYSPARPATSLSNPGAVGTAGLETSALALGQARAALAALVDLSPDRTDLAEPLEVLCENWQTYWGQLIAQARGEADAVSPGQIRTQANALVLRSTQALSHGPTRDRVSSGPSPPSDGRARPSSSWSGRAPRRSPRPPSATWPACARCNDRLVSGVTTESKFMACRRSSRSSASARPRGTA